MDDRRCRQYFLQPQETFQRRYEALRAVFVDGQPLADVAAHFGSKVAALKSIVSRFRAARRQDLTPPLFALMAGDVPLGDAAARTSTAPSGPRSPTAGNGTSNRGERSTLAWRVSSCSCRYWPSWVSTAW
jgi:hypothetical protein